LAFVHDIVFLPLVKRKRRTEQGKLQGSLTQPEKTKGNIYFPEFTFRKIIFQIFLYLFIIIKVGQRKTLSD
jgi:hypothetical protein